MSRIQIDKGRMKHTDKVSGGREGHTHDPGGP